MTLAFSWATNTNYSTGPDNGTPTKVDPASTANGFVNGTIAAAQHVNFLFDAVGDQIVQAVDGVGGGTYTLGAALRFQGADVEINAGLEILAAGELNVQSGGLVQVLSGGLIDVLSGGQIEISSGASISVVSGGLIDVIAGGTIEFNASEDLKIDDVVDSFRLTLTPQSIAQSGGANTWAGQNFGAGWLQSVVSSGFAITFPINLPVGDTIVSVTVAVNGGFGGGHASLPTTTDRLNVELYQVSGAGVATSLARRFDQSASVGAYDAPHTVVLANGALDAGTMPQLVDDDFAYYVVVRGEQGANAIANTTLVTSISGSCIARSYRSALMVY